MQVLPIVTAYRRGVTNLYIANAMAKYPACESRRGPIIDSLTPIYCNAAKTSTPLQ